jgi:replicative superfamily II helicase
MIDSKLSEYATSGVAFHHAGLDTVDRHTVENMFIDGGLMLIVSTSVGRS